MRSRRTTKKNRSSDKVATRRAGQMEDPKNRTDMKKEARLLRCTSLNASTWSTENCMRRYKGKCDISFGTEHRLRKEE